MLIECKEHAFWMLRGLKPPPFKPISSPSHPLFTKELVADVTRLVVLDSLAPLQQALRVDMRRGAAAGAGLQELPSFFARVQAEAAGHGERTRLTPNWLAF